MDPLPAVVEGRLFSSWSSSSSLVGVPGEGGSIRLFLGSTGTRADDSSSSRRFFAFRRYVWRCTYAFASFNSLKAT